MILPQQAAPIPRAGAVPVGLGQVIGISPAGGRPAKFWAQCPNANDDMLISKKKPTHPNAQILKTKFKCKAQTGWNEVTDPVQGIPKAIDPIKLEEFDLHD